MSDAEASASGGIASGFRRLTLDDLDYVLPESLIAQQPVEPRDAARLLVVGPGDAIAEARVADLPRFLRPGDLLVLNDTRVVAARFFLRRTSGGRVEGLFLREQTPGRWEVLLRNAGRCREGERLSFETECSRPPAVTLRERGDDGHWLIEVTPPHRAADVLALVGMTPLPPYIRRDAGALRALEVTDRERYQTVYAKSPGAAAAPTAGLHFTPELLAALRRRGIEQAFVTLHVGEGTFKPVTADRLEDHVMHAESFDLPEATVEAIRRCRERGGRVTAVGTTTVRVLESCVDKAGTLVPRSGQTRLFILPPFRFRTVDVLLTNFHLPRSTLLALVMAFGGVERIRAAYRRAVETGCRFYSYGDAMLVFPA
ncbi:MAG: S-adenosylmethionine:tRNA ribosyltransferase-isomerase [Phycisphaerae bacterium]|nr:S-adenosylmethionine:tRNA ribosyltransferase-isomerase [Phycisphaerae bacterium]